MVFSIMASTFGVVVQWGKNQVVHIYPNWTSPIRCIMLCIVFHVQWAVAKADILISCLMKFHFEFIGGGYHYLVFASERIPKSLHKIVLSEMRLSCFSKIHDCCAHIWRHKNCDMVLYQHIPSVSCQVDETQEDREKAIRSFMPQNWPFPFRTCEKIKARVTMIYWLDFILYNLPEE